jgi:hypothetical protein
MSTKPKVCKWKYLYYSHSTGRTYKPACEDSEKVKPGFVDRCKCGGKIEVAGHEH